MSIDNILKKIADNTENQKRIILDAATKRREEIISEAEQQAKRIREQTLAQAEKKIEEELQQTLAAARLEIKKLELENKRKILSEVYKKSFEKISSLSEKELKNFFLRMLETLISGGEEIVVSGKYKKTFPTSELKNVQVKFDNIKEIFILKKDGSETRFSWEIFLENLKHKTEINAAKILFENE